MIEAIDMGATHKKISPAVGKTYEAAKKAQVNYTKSNVYTPRPDFQIVRQAAYGQWVHIHIAAGAKPYSNSHRHHAKCYCGGKDRMRILPDYANTGRWYCNGGGDQQSGDGFSWLCHALNWSPAESLKFVADYLGLSKTSESELAEIRQKAAAQAAKIAELTKAKDDANHRNHDLKNLAEDLIDAIKHREYLQRNANRAGSFDIIADTESEHRIVKTIVNIYASQYREVQHAGL